MSWILTGAIIWIAGKIIKSNIVSQLGLALVVVGIIMWIIGFLGFSLPFGL